MCRVPRKVHVLFLIALSFVFTIHVYATSTLIPMYQYQEIEQKAWEDRMESWGFSQTPAIEKPDWMGKVLVQSKPDTALTSTVREKTKQLIDALYYMHYAMDNDYSIESAYSLMEAELADVIRSDGYFERLFEDVKSYEVSMNISGLAINDDVDCLGTEHYGIVYRSSAILQYDIMTPFAYYGTI